MELSCRSLISQNGLAGQIQAACILECSARKPGNVHPSASFSDVSYLDFVRSAEAIAPILASASQTSIGQSIRDAVVATQQAVGSNTNLGMILLLAPLAAIPDQVRTKDGIARVLAQLDSNDANLVYSAISLAKPGGLGTVQEEDVSAPPAISLIEAMRLASDRDLVARQYANQFNDVLGFGRNSFLNAIDAGHDWETAIITTQLHLMAAFPDSLIGRKCGEAIALESQRQAELLIHSTWDGTVTCPHLAEFDVWLRSDRNRRNPGTTADLIAAILFAVLRDNEWTPPDKLSTEILSFRSPN
ncbi:triphosphoribosyl-dephospho-CoA synthase [Planctomicrobium sp. SH527]|uniref:triphosphoribosyl-dephospho-CoA synthase n=1 Tax=Planctomicrobium sp. SH527 TaxID=3448123 RepID=UPI003F5C302E